MPMGDILRSLFLKVKSAYFRPSFNLFSSYPETSFRGFGGGNASVTTSLYSSPSRALVVVRFLTLIDGRDGIDCLDDDDIAHFEKARWL